MKNDFTRRRFLRTAGAAASVAILGQSLSGGGAALPAPTFVRRDIGGLSASDRVIVSYRKAITAMKALPASDPRSWTYQAAIHGTLLSPPQTAWNTCEHHTAFFWPWHRMYLYWFERIIRRMSGDSRWALPFWNWSSPSERQLPAMFRDPASELYVAERRTAMNAGGSLSAFDVENDLGFSLVNFTRASDSLESTPHDAVHVDVGGWMGSVPTAAQDPIFYLHHCNMDRLWNLWLAQGGGRSNPLADATWRTRPFTFFNEKGNQVQMTSCDVLRAAQQLDYRYEEEPAQVNQFCLRIVRVPIFERVVLIRLPIPPVVLGAALVTVDFDVTQLRERLAAIAGSQTETLFLELDDVEAERQPGVVWEVYVGAPANHLQRDPASPYYVGNVALFSTGIRSEADHEREANHEFKPARFAFPLNRAILAALEVNEERVPITFAPHGVLIDGEPSHPKEGEVESTVRIGQMSLTVETEKQLK
jgi:hypothetical protein